MEAELKVVRDTYTKNSTQGRLYINGTFFCDTLEDVCRDLNKDGDLDDKGETKIAGETAIPSGSYKMIVNVSERFKILMPLLVKVKDFEGVRIHAGNTKDDTHGCILVGLTRIRDGVGQSRAAFAKLMDELKKYDKYKITIVDTL